MLDFSLAGHCCHQCPMRKVCSALQCSDVQPMCTQKCSLPAALQHVYRCLHIQTHAWLAGAAQSGSLTVMALMVPRLHELLLGLLDWLACVYMPSHVTGSRL